MSTEKELTSAIQSLIKKEDEMKKQREELFAELCMVLKKSIFEQNLLCEGAWELDYTYLRLFSYQEKLPNLVKIMRKIEYDTWVNHFGITLKEFSKESRIELRYDDGELSISFIGCQDEIPNFIRENKLNITTKELDSKIEDLAKSLENLTKIKDEMVKRTGEKNESGNNRQTES